MKQKIMLRILGCARSGTLYTTEVLQACGIKVEHEFTGKEGTVSCYAVGRPPYPHLHQNPEMQHIPHRKENIEQIPWTATLHQVREPLKVIESVYFVLTEPAWKWYAEKLNIPHRSNITYRSMLYWLRWNELCEKLAKMTYRLENIQGEWNTILYQCGLPVGTPFPAHISTTTNRKQRNVIPFKDRKYKINDWQQLEDIDPVLTKAIIQKAKQYGYEL